VCAHADVCESDETATSTMDTTDTDVIQDSVVTSAAIDNVEARLIALQAELANDPTPF
jgi:hypothetical protein